MRIIRGKYGRRRFTVPTNITARPTTDFARENIFNVIDNLIDLEDAKCLDLFAGTGAISFELLSRGAASVTAVEKSPVQGRFIEKVARERGDSEQRPAMLFDTYVKPQAHLVSYLLTLLMILTVSVKYPQWCSNPSFCIRAASS